MLEGGEYGCTERKRSDIVSWVLISYGQIWHYKNKNLILKVHKIPLGSLDETRSREDSPPPTDDFKEWKRDFHRSTKTAFGCLAPQRAKLEVVDPKLSTCCLQPLIRIRGFLRVPSLLIKNTLLPVYKDTTSKRVYEELDMMKEILHQMWAANIRQPNISVVFKNELERLNNSLEVVQSMRCLRHV